MNVNLGVSAPFFFMTLAWASLAFSVDEPIDEVGAAVVPSRVESASFKLPLPEGRTRTIRIHRGKASSGTTSYDYFHQPIFAFAQRDSKLDGLPDTVQKQTITDEAVFYDFSIIAYNENTEETSKHYLRDAREVEGEANFEFGKVRVFPWPLTRVIAEVSGNNGTYLWGTHGTDSLADEGETWILQVRIPIEQKELFERHLNSGDLLFRFRFTYENVVQTSVLQETRVQKTFASNVEKALRSLSISEGDPIRQSQETALRSELTSLITTNITGFGPELKEALGQLSSDPVKAIFKGKQLIPVTDLNKIEPPELAKQLFSHIQAILNEYDTKKTAVDETESTREDSTTVTDKQEDTTTKKVKLKGSYGKVATAEGEVVDTDKDTYEIKEVDREEIKNKHGLTLVEGSTTGELVPAEIYINFVSETWESQVSRSVQNIALGSTNSKGYRVASPVPISFTRDQIRYPAEALGSQQSRNPFVPPGAALCYFGSNIPDGYKLVDSDNIWPDSENWVPEILKGKVMPDMSRGSVVVGTNDINSLGSRNSSRDMSIGPVDIKTTDRVQVDLSDAVVATNSQMNYSDDTVKFTLGSRVHVNWMADPSQLNMVLSNGTINAGPPIYDKRNPFPSVENSFTNWTKIDVPRTSNYTDRSITPKKYSIYGKMPVAKASIAVENLPNVTQCRWIVRVN